MKHPVQIIACILVGLIASAADADRIELRNSIRRPSVDQPVRLADVARLEGPLALRFADLVVIPVDGFHGDDRSVSLTVGELRDRLDEAGAGWARLELCGGTVVVRPVATVRRPRARAAASASPESASLVPSVTLGDDWCSVRDAMATSGKELIRHAASFIAEAVDGRDLDRILIRLDPRGLDRLGEDLTDLTVRARGEVLVDRFDLNLLGRSASGTTRTAQVPVDVRIVRDVPVAVDDIGRGRRIMGDGIDLRVERRPMRPSSVIVDVERLVGRQTIKRIGAGEAVLAPMMQPETLVTKGSVVTVTIRCGDSLVSGPMTARQSGCLGDLIECARSKNDKPVKFRIVGFNQVEPPTIH